MKYFIPHETSGANTNNGVGEMSALSKLGFVPMRPLSSIKTPGTRYSHVVVCARDHCYVNGEVLVYLLFLFFCNGFGDEPYSMMEFKLSSRSLSAHGWKHAVLQRHAISAEAEAFNYDLKVVKNALILFDCENLRDELQKECGRHAEKEYRRRTPSSDCELMFTLDDSFVEFYTDPESGISYGDKAWFCRSCVVRNKYGTEFVRKAHMCRRSKELTAEGNR